MSNPDISLTAPPDYASQLLQQQRAQQIAQALQQQAAQPLSTNFGNAPAPISWASLLAKGLQAGGGAYIGSKAMDEQKALNTQDQQSAQALIQNALGVPPSAGPVGAPGQPPTPPPAQMTAGPSPAQPPPPGPSPQAPAPAAAQPGAPATAPDPNAQLAAVLMARGGPQTQNIQSELLPLLIQRQERQAENQQNIANQMVTPLSDDEAAALHLRQGGVYGRNKATGNITVIQPSDLKSPGAIQQEQSEATFQNQMPMTAAQQAENKLGYAQLNKPMAVGMGDSIYNPATRQFTPGPSPFGAASTAPPGVTGGDYLKTLPPQVAGVVKSIGDGKMSLSGFARNPQMAMQMREMVTQYSPSYDETTMPTRTAARKDFIGGPDGKAVTAISTSVDHLANLGQLATALGNGNTQLINSASQAFAQQFGKAAPTNFDSLRQIVGDEIVKALIGTGGSKDDRDKASATISRASSPAQLAGAIQTYQNALAGKLGPLRQKYQFNTKLQDFSDMLTPQTNSVLGSLPQGQDADTSQGGTSLPGGWSVKQK